MRTKCCVRPADHSLPKRHFGNLEEKRGWAARDKEGTKTKLSAQGSILISANTLYKEKGKPVPGQAKFL